MLMSPLADSLTDQSNGSMHMTKCFHPGFNPIPANNWEDYGGAAAEEQLEVECLAQRQLTGLS